MDLSQNCIVGRAGYGSSFNEISIQGNTFIKKAKNAYGEQKLQKEIDTYRFIQKHAPAFPLAKLLSIDKTSFTLLYYKGYSPLWRVYESSNELQREALLRKVFNHLNTLHTGYRQSVTKEEYIRLLRLEVITKVKERYMEVKHILDEYPFEYVNGVRCLSFHDCISYLETAIDDFVQKKSDYFLCLFHGDPQFNNILYDTTSEDMIFIDPRGYFGDTFILGIEEYDIAKVLFALSGYDSFDSQQVFTNKIVDKNIHIPDFTLDSRFYTMFPEIQFLLVSIWLANCHCFKDNLEKMLVSHAYARLFATNVFRSQISIQNLE